MMPRSSALMNAAFLARRNRRECQLLAAQLVQARLALAAAEDLLGSACRKAERLVLGPWRAMSERNDNGQTVLRGDTLASVHALPGADGLDEPALERTLADVLEDESAGSAVPSQNPYPVIDPIMAAFPAIACFLGRQGWRGCKDLAAQQLIADELRMAQRAVDVFALEAEHGVRRMLESSLAVAVAIADGANLLTEVRALGSTDPDTIAEMEELASELATLLDAIGDVHDDSLVLDSFTPALPGWQRTA